MADLKPKGERGVRKTDYEGVYTPAKSPRELDAMREHMADPAFQDLTLSEQLLYQCNQLVRDAEGKVFDNLLTVEDMGQFSTDEINDIITACMDVHAGVGKRRSRRG